MGLGREWGWQLCFTQPLIVRQASPGYTSWVRQVVRERVNPTEHHFPLILLAEASHKASPNLGVRKQTPPLDGRVTFQGHGWGRGGRIGPLLQSVFNTGVPSSFGEKPSRLLDTGTPLSWCQFTEKTNKWVMDVIQTIEESSPWQVVGCRTASDWMLLALLWMWN